MICPEPISKALVSILRFLIFHWFPKKYSPLAFYILKSHQQLIQASSKSTKSFNISQKLKLSGFRLLDKQSFKLSLQKLQQKPGLWKFNLNSNFVSIESKGVVGKEHTLRDLSLRREAAVLYMIGGRLSTLRLASNYNYKCLVGLSVSAVSTVSVSAAVVTLSFNVGFEEARAILTPFTSKLLKEHSHPHCHILYNM